MTATLHHVLTVALAASPTTALCVAFSGGPDSTALLHALAQLSGARAHNLRALHVDHGLQAQSARWSEHCREFCESLDIPLRVVCVDARDVHGEGIEGAARRARHAAFAAELHDGERLVLAHHRDDQVETVLLKLLRGAGPEGLGGMRALRPFGRGFLWRPLLEVPRNVLREYVVANGLHCIDDPANADPRFSRNVVRNEVMPRIVSHWPNASASILHAARLCRITFEHISREAEAALVDVRHADGTLDADGWLAMPPALRTPALHHWLHARNLSAPGDTATRELEHQIATAAEDAVPCITWPGAEVRIWDGRLHATPSLAPVPKALQIAWDGTRLVLPKDCGILTLEPLDHQPAQPSARFDPPLAVRLRQGGERIKPAGDTCTRELRDLFQQARVPPWLRVRCPLIYENDELIAVADLWISYRGRRMLEPPGVRLLWDRPGWA